MFFGPIVFNGEAVHIIWVIGVRATTINALILEFFFQEGFICLVSLVWSRGKAANMLRLWVSVWAFNATSHISRSGVREVLWSAQFPARRFRAARPLVRRLVQQFVVSAQIKL